MTRNLDLMTLSNAADESGYSVAQLSGAIHDGDLAATMVGGRWILTRDALNAYLDALDEDEDDDEEDEDEGDEEDEVEGDED